MHRKYKAGSQTFAQLAAERANLQKARMAKGQGRHTSAHRVPTWHHSTAKTRASAAADRAYKEMYLSPGTHHPLASKYMHYSQKMHPVKPRLSRTGRPKRFLADVGATRYLARSSWGKALKPISFRKVIKQRKSRLVHIKGWRRRRNVYIPT